MVWFESVKTGLWPGFSWSGLLSSGVIKFQPVWPGLVWFEAVKVSLSQFGPVLGGLGRSGPV